MLYLIAWFELVIGVLIAGLWITLLVKQQVSEIRLGRRDIFFHVAAELITSILLIGAGTSVLVRSKPAESAVSVAAGALLYTTINSAGYYADRLQWEVVTMFGVLTLATSIAIFILITGYT